MFFSERSHTPRPVLSSCVSMTALAANVQQVPNGFWSFTGVTHPLSRESHDDGRGVDFKRLGDVVAPSARLIFIVCGGGRNPVGRTSSPAAAIDMTAAQTVAVRRRTVPLADLRDGFVFFMCGISIAYSAQPVPTFGYFAVRVTRQSECDSPLRGGIAFTLSCHPPPVFSDKLCTHAQIYGIIVAQLERIRLCLK